MTPLRRRPGLLAVVALALAAVLVAACGVPGDSQPRAIDPKNVPFQLLAPTAEATTTTQPSAFAASVKVTIYLADANGQLKAVRRQVTAPATPSKVVAALLAGPSKDEADTLHTAITSDTKLLDVDGPTDGLVTLDLSRHLLDITGRTQILALAQVVYTATSLPSVDRVLFEFDGQAVEVPNGDGTVTASPLGRLSYRDLVPG